MRQVSTFERGAPVAVFEEERESNEDNAEDNLLEENSGQKSLRRELFKLESESESEEEDYTARRERERQVLEVTDSVVGRLVWELLEQTVRYPKMLRHFRVRGPAIVPEPITAAERL